jgi:hypothetical protein
MTTNSPRKPKLNKKGNDVRMNINNKYYETSTPYPERPTKPRLPIDHTAIIAKEYALELSYYERLQNVYKEKIKEYNADSSCLMDEYKLDILRDCKLSDHPARHKAYSMAWERGRSSGLMNVLAELEELADLLL